MVDMFVHVILAAVGADPGRDIFYDKSPPVAIKDGGCRALFDISVFADDEPYFFQKIIH